MSASDLEQRIRSNVKPKKETPYSIWKEVVLESYPNVFFPAISAKTNKILKAVVENIQEQEVDVKVFFTWTVDNWLTLSKRTGITIFDKYPYPELDVVLYNYAKLLNFYINQPTFINTNQKKKVDLSFLSK